MDEAQVSKNPKNVRYILDADLVGQRSLNVLLIGGQLVCHGTWRRQTDHLRLAARTFSSQDYHRLNVTCRPKEGMEINSKSQSLV